MIRHQRKDELGALIDSFNDMLAQVAARDGACSNTATSWNARSACAPSSWKSQECGRGRQSGQERLPGHHEP
jgi:hypothetical protein